MMEAAPASPLEMREAEFAFQFLVVALDPPTQFGRVDENIERGAFGQGRKPVFRRLLFALGPFDEKPFEGMGRRALPIARGRPYPHGGKARGQDFVGALSPRDDAPSLLGKPHRQFLGGDRRMFAVTPDARCRAAPSTPGFGRQRLHAGGPDAERRLHSDRIGQPQGRDARAERAVDPITGVGQQDPVATPAASAALI